ncbi:MAG TPA: PDZ domain-containing protein [bacterium]|jgi:hypothetical protein
MRKSIFSRLFLLALASISFLTTGIRAQNGEQEKYLLRWDPQDGMRYTYELSTTGTRGENIAVRAEEFVLEVMRNMDGRIDFAVSGEDVPDRARLGLRFQRAYFPSFDFSVDENGNYEVERGQPFPPFMNIPIFPDFEVGEGDIWSGGPVPVLNDANVGFIPFSYSSTLMSKAEFRGEQCVVIETEYTIDLPPDSYTVAPFLGLVEGDEPEEPGSGALIGGIVEDSRAHKAGIEPGDIITEAEGERIRGWGGLREIFPHLVPEKTVEFTIDRGGEEIKISVAPEAYPIAGITGTGGMDSTVFFSLDRRIPLKIDLVSKDLIFTLTDDDGESEERPADFHIILDYQYGR